MTLIETILRKLGKEETIKLALEYHSKFDSTLSTINDIKTDLPELRKYYKKLESDLVVTKQVNTKLCNQMKFLKCHCWVTEQYSRRECLQISGVPESVIDKDLVGKLLDLFEKIDIEDHADNIKACHWEKSNAVSGQIVRNCGWINLFMVCTLPLLL